MFGNKKLNLSALVEEEKQELENIEDTKETPVEETPVEETPVEETPVEETPVEETPVEETPVEETPVEETPVEETDEEREKRYEQMTSKITFDEEVKEDIDIGEENSEIFGNYTSEFKGKENIIFENFKKLKNLPKTNPIFVGTIILITISFIGSLFVLAPEKHSFTIYKNNIQDVLDGVSGVTEIPWKMKFKNIEGYDIPVEYRIDKDGTTQYRYDDVIYTNGPALNKAVMFYVDSFKEENKGISDEEIKKMIKEKILKIYLEKTR